MNFSSIKIYIFFLKFLARSYFSSLERLNRNLFGETNFRLGLLALFTCLRFVTVSTVFIYKIS